jgi:TonB-linked SusC/RagA family outer membrane protein
MPRFRRLLAAVLALALISTMARAQERGTLVGVVSSDNTGQPLGGAQVTVLETTLRATADENGRFQIQNVPVGAQTLRVTRLGYRPTMLGIQVTAGVTTANIAMASDPLRLEEMVVTGYGEERRRNLTGAISSLRMDEVTRDVPIVSLQAAIQGRVPGVMVVQNAGNPGNAMTVRVRGSSSISGGNDPLYVIDGVPMTQGNQEALNGGYGGQGIDAISDLNSSEIERIEVLKDASAAAIYGSRASNGVVLITTKRGTSSRPEITFGTYYGNQRAAKRLDLLNAQEYMLIYNEGVEARFGPATASGYDQWYCYSSTTRSCETEAIPGTNTDWLSLVLRPATIGNFEGSVRGGTERVRYYVAGGGLQQEGMIKTTGYQRLNGRVNLDYVPREKLALGTNVSLARSVTDRHGSDNTIYSAWANAIGSPPIEPVYNADGTYYETLYANPVAMNEVTESEERGIRILGNAFGQYEVFEGIIGRLSAGLDQLTMNGRRYDSPTFGPGAPSGGRGQVGNNYVTKNSYEATVSLNRVLAAAHAVSGVVGSSVETNTENWNYVEGTQFPTESFKYLTSAALISAGTSTRDDWNLFSLFGRLTYTFKDRVTTTFNVRRDGSSRFGSDHRHGLFPSTSVNWRIGDESFMQNQSIVGNLALRASYGITGNQQSLGNFASRGLFRGGANYLDAPGIFPSQLANSDLRWERTTQRNVGADVSILNERISFTLDLYHKRTDDLLVRRPVPRTTGFNSIWSNVGSMDNKGYEVSTTLALFRARAARGFDWQAIVNLSHNSNKVLELYDNQPFATGFGGRVQAGLPLGFFYGHVTDGIFKSAAEVAAHATQTVHSNARRATAPGDIRFRDLNGDKVINDDDRAMIGNPWPDLEGGITNTVSWRGFDASAFLQFSLGNDILNAQQIYMAQYGSGGDNHTTAALDRWTPTNMNTNEPRAIWGDPNRNTRFSDRFVEDGSYWRVKNVVLGYTLSPTLVSRAMRARTVRVYVQAQNLKTFTDYSGFDPEVNSNGNSSTARGEDFYALPQPRTITFGLNLAF